MTDRWLIFTAAAVILWLALFAIVLYAALADVHAQLDVACHGVIANLDLTEWVQLCKAD